MAMVASTMSVLEHTHARHSLGWPAYGQTPRVSRGGHYRHMAWLGKAVTISSFNGARVGEIARLLVECGGVA